jgi:hypothetical protein
MKKIGHLSPFSLLGICIAVMFGNASLARAGGEVSGGGDNLDPATGAAWFVGFAPVRFCIHSTPSFGVSDEVVTAEILESAKTWSDYVVNKRIGFQVDMNLAKSEICDGTEDLDFYLGMKGPDEVERARSQYDDLCGPKSRGPASAENDGDRVHPKHHVKIDGICWIPQRQHQGLPAQDVPGAPSVRNLFVLTPV